MTRRQRIRAEQLSGSCERPRRNILTKVPRTVNARPPNPATETENFLQDTEGNPILDEVTGRGLYDNIGQ